MSYMISGENREPAKNKVTKVERPKQVKQAPTKKTNSQQFWRRKKG